MVLSDRLPTLYNGEWTPFLGHVLTTRNQKLNEAGYAMKCVLTTPGLGRLKG